MPPVTTASRAPGPFRLTDEHEMLRDAVRVLADERVAPRAAEIRSRPSTAASAGSY